MILKNLFVLIALFVLITPFGFSQEEEIAPAPNYSEIDNELASLEGASDSSGLGAKIILIFSVLVILAIVGFFIYNKNKNTEVAQEVNEVAPEKNLV